MGSYSIKMYTLKKIGTVWKNNRVVVSLAAIVVVCGIMLGIRTPLIAVLQGRGGPQLTVIARADGTFDIKEFSKQGQWFSADVVGTGLQITAGRRFGKNVTMANVNVLMQADPGVEDETIRVGLASLAHSGFRRVGFTDPRLSELARRVVSSPLPAPLSGLKSERVASAAPN
jgi:hypothetical protein